MSTSTGRDPHPRNEIFVNGRFLGRPMTGVERFAGMILQEADSLQAASSPSHWTVLAPPGVKKPDYLKHIAFKTVGSLKGHAWEQIDLWRASRRGTLVNLCNSGPILHGRQLTVLHDALVYRHPENFSKAYGRFHRLLGRLLSYRSNLATVSNFSRMELSSLLKVPADRIVVIPNAVDHMHGIQPDLSVLDQFDLRSRPFFLFVGSPAPNKNLVRAVLGFKALNRPEIAFVIVGSAAKTFADDALQNLPGNVIRTGRLTDEQIQGLYRSALALVFPSIYEGFGIPPLEAMNADCLVLAADVPSVREVCANAADYFDPLSVSSIEGAMRRSADHTLDDVAMRAAAQERIREFSWHSSAERLVAAVDHIAQKNTLP